MAVLESIIGLIAPPLCAACGTEGRAICTECEVKAISPYGERCYNCGATSPFGRTCILCQADSPVYTWVTTYYQDTARQLVRAYKFGHQRAVAGPIAKLMSQTLAGFINPEELRNHNFLAIPVPTATSRVRQRGFDHSALLAREVARHLGLKQRNALVRLGQSSQVGAERSVRLRQPSGSYHVRRKSLVAGRNILLIDDVVTTGATLRAGTQALYAAGAANVSALVFAKRV